MDHTDYREVAHFQNGQINGKNFIVLPCYREPIRIEIWIVITISNGFTQKIVT